MTDDQLTASYILTLSCPDRPGIVHAVAGALLVAGGNITDSQQYGSQSTGTFFHARRGHDGGLPRWSFRPPWNLWPRPSACSGA